MTPTPRKIALDFINVRKNTARGLMSDSCYKTSTANNTLLRAAPRMAPPGQTRVIERVDRVRTRPAGERSLGDPSMPPSVRRLRADRRVVQAQTPPAHERPQPSPSALSAARRRRRHHGSGP